MKKFVIAVLLSGTMMGITGLAEDRVFQIDPVHSSVQFRIRHLYSTVVGRFNKFDGTISGDPANPASMKVSASVDVTSIDTANGAREKHLRSPDFFDTDHHPTATFESTKTTLGNKKDSGSVTGKLTIRGITKDVTFQGQFLGSGVAPQSRDRAGFHATTTLNRFDFGVAFNGALTNGMTLLGNEVELILDIEAVETSAATGQAGDKPAAK
ncbi:MAG: YceI family protein [bacterium]